MKDLIIVGGGPAGAAAAVYASRKELETILLTDTFGGQSIVSEDIQNWIGTPHISGEDLAKALKDHVREYAGNIVEVKEGLKAEKIEKKEGHFVVHSGNDSFVTRAILICAGAHRRKLSVPGADEFENKGITYCASCDGPLFKGKDVVVIGGGNAGFETAAQLLKYTKSVTLLHRSPEYRADPVTVKKVLSHENMTGITNAETLGVKGDTFVTSLTYKNIETGEEHEIPTEGIFVEIGLIPATEFVSDILELDDYKRIVIDPWTQAASVPGIWAAGDCTNVRYHQNNIAAGDAVRALEDIYVFLHAK